MKRGDARRRDGGTITVLAIGMLVTLFAAAALAVDVGFLYVRSRMIYAVADSLVAAGMGDIVAGSTSNATTDVTNLAAQYGAAYSVSLTPAPTLNTLSVQVSATYPLFFGRMLGFGSKTMTVTAVGKKGVPTPALLALGTSCAGTGLQINGNGGMTVNGDVDGNGILNFQTGGTCPVPPGTGGAHINGSANAGCGGPWRGGSPGQWCWDTVTGSYGPGPTVTDPFAPFTVPPCDFGGLAFGGDPTAGHWNLVSGTTYQLDPGVYCTSAPTLAPNGPGQGVQALGVTFIENGGTINIGVNLTSSYSAAANSPNGVIAYTNYAGPCGGTPAINVGGPAFDPFQTLTMNGSLYAPSGCINAGSNDATTINGSFIGNEVSLGDYGNWTITSGGGPTGPNWQMSQ